MENRVHSAIAAKKNLNLFNRSFGAVGSPYQTNETQSRQRRKLTLACHLRAICLLFALLTIGVGQVWGVDFTGGKIYFRNDVTNWSTSAIQIFAHQSGYTWVSSSMSAVSNTKLYYVNASCNWGGFVSYRICGNSSAWNSGSFTNQSSSTKYTGANSSYGLNSGSIYLITPANANNGCTISPAYYSSNSNFLKYTATAKVKTSTNGSSYTTVTSGTWPATVNIKGTYLSGDGATTRSDVATSSGASGTYDAVATGLITMTYSSLSSDYAFAGWGTGDTPSSTSESYAYNIGAATTVYAFFKKKHTVTFNANGHGSAPSSQTVVAGAKASTPTAPTATGYTFGGWYKEVGCTNAWNFSSDVVTANTTLYAKWTPQTYDITYKDEGNVDFSGVHGDGYPTTHTYGTATALVSPTKDGFTFGGWYGNSACTGTVLTSIGATARTANFTLYAKWTENTFDVTTTKNISSAGSVTPTTWTAMGVVNGGSITATPNTGYDFDHWSVSTSGGGYFGATGTATTTTTANTVFRPLKNNVTIKAWFTAKTINLTLDKNGGDSDGSATVVYNTNALATKSDASRAGYSLTGYWTAESGGDKVINSDGSLNNVAGWVSGGYWVKATDGTLYAQWEESAVYYTLNFTYGTSSTGYVSVAAKNSSTEAAISYGASLVSGTGVTVTATPETHYKFVGWYSNAACSSSVSTDNPYSFTMSANTSLYAKVELMTTTVTFNKNGGSGSTPATLTATHGSNSLSSGYVAPTRTGYNFSGWYDAESGGNKVFGTNGVITSSSGYADGSGNWTYTGNTLTVYAQWTAKNYTVTLDKQSGSGGPESVSATYNAAMPSTTMPTRTGYDFQGYYGSAGGSGTKYYNSDGSNAHVWDQAAARTIYAYWTAHNYSITYSPASAPTGCTYSTKPTSADYNTTVDMVITPASGYTISVSAVDASSSPVTVTAGASNHYTFTQPASSVTVTVTATERKSTVTVTTATSSQGTLKFGSTGKDWGTTTSVGVATTQNITATAAAGFTFVRWDLSGAAATASSTTSATITLKADGSGDTGTATAVFAEDLSSPWIVAGGNKIVSGDTWRTTADANNSMVKKTGHSTESVVYFTVPVTTVCSGDNNGNYQFKIYNTSTSKWYGLDADGSSYYLLKAEDGTQKSLVEGYKNIELRAYVTGDYVFRLDYSTSTPKLTVTWPVFNQVRISNASPSDATNVGNFDMSDPVSNVRSVKRTLNANTTYTFKIMYDSDWFGYNSGTFTRSTSTSSNQRTISTSGGDMTLTTDYAGDYTFKFNESTKALSVDFPEAYKITFGKGSVDGTSGSFSAVNISNGNSAVTSNSTWVKSGHNVKITAPSAKSGYRFLGWYDNNSATGDAITTLANCTITVNTTKTVYACYAENLTAITITTDGHGTITTPSPNSSPYSLGVTTTQAINASANTGYHWNTWTVSGTAALGTTATTASNTAKGNGTNGSTGTVTATFSPNTYSVKFNGNGSTSGSMSNQAFTYDVAQALTSNAFVKTGYNFAGWATVADGDVTYSNGQSVSNLTSTNGATYNLHAKWTPKQSALTFDYQTGDAGYKSSGTITVTSSATYDATMPALSGNVPTAKDGYAFIGFFDGTDSGAKKYYNADKSSAATWDKDTESGTTLYAHYKKAEITALTFVSGTVAPNEVNGVKVTPVVDPALGSIGTVHIDWRVLYDNDDPLTDQPAQTAYNTTGIQFNAPESSGTYKVEATLRTGATANAGTVISTTKALFVVAGNHTVTLKYMSGSYTIQPSTTIGGTPLDWTEITAPTLVGYTFANWTLGEGITIDTSDGKSVNDATIYFKASYDGTLTANYTKKKMIYFNNTVGWSDVYVYFYNSDRYWSNETNASGSKYASGAKINEDFGGYKPYTGEHGHMTRIEGTNVWYFDYQAESIPDRTVVTFTEGNQHGYQFFNDTKVVRAINFNPSYMPMYVPLAEPVAEYNKHDGVKADYYEKGYWMNYPDYTGYWLKMFNKKSNSDAPDAGSAPVTVKDIPFGFSADMAMPLSVKVDLEAGKTYGFKIYRANDASGTWYGNDGTMVSGNSGANGATPWGMWSDQSSNCGLTTTVAGEYVFTLRFAPDGEGNNHTYRVGVEYPVSVGDYRIFYKDGATWSQGTAHGVLWHHSSSVIPKNYGTEAKADTVSLFVSVGSSPSMKFQYVSAINASTGEVTWADVASGSISTPSSVTSGGAGVYNFIVNQPAGGASISLTKAEPYTGNYYIRSDVAGTTKWDNYKANDHLMQYSDYADQNETFTHSFTKYVPRGNNVKFTIANDYSPCISDTLIRDVDMSFNNMAENGTLNSDGNPDPTYDVNSANIRFMWNQKTNKINRAYIGGSAVDRFLVMLGDAKLLNESGAALDNNEIKFRDDQNFIYEVTIKAVPTAHVKVTAEYKDKVQYFKGTSAGGALTDDNSVEILGGSGSTPQKMRIVYDFKTNRLVCAWQPSGDITGEIDINADVMIIREGQGVAEQIKFTTNESKLGQVKNVYGVMCFNRWTLANKNKDSHNPLPDGSTASIAERRMYFISFPFDVNLGDIFGLGAYDDHWWIQYYDGKARAKECFWAESKGFWKFLENTPGAKLKANEGYILTLGSEMLRSDNTDIWVNNIDQVELFFPSAAVVENIEKTDATVTLDAYTCTETRDSRNIKDSHWHCMGVPSYANYDKNVTDGSSAISWGTERWSALNVPFLYNWNKVDNTLTVHTSNDYDFQAMHAYMVQYHGDVKWSSTSVPKAVAARKRAGYKGSYEFRLELQKDGVMTDQTYVNLTDDEQATKAFDFNLDLSKEGSTRSTICTVTSDAIPVAGNSMPLETESTTVVPVSVSIKVDGEYTFAMPDGTEGMVVTLVDNETNMHTNLALGTYTLELTAGTYEGRFALEIDPRNAPTTIDIIGGEGEDAAPRKVFINGLMYILRGDKVYDANGRVVQ